MVGKGWAFVLVVGEPGQVDLVPGNMARAERGGGDAGLSSEFLKAGYSSPRGWGLPINSLEPLAPGVWHLTVTDQGSYGVQMMGRKG